MKCVAKKVYTMTSDAPTEEALIEFADSLDPNGLDSMDLGDAMGAFLGYMDTHFETDNEMLVAPEGFTVTISWTWDLFQWEERP